MLGKLKASRILRWSSLAPRTLETLHRLHVLNYSTNDKEFCNYNSNWIQWKFCWKL